MADNRIHRCGAVACEAYAPAKDRRARCLQADMRIANNKFHATQPALNEALQERAPMHRLFRERH